jgi:hypothetical protein
MSRLRLARATQSRNQRRIVAAGTRIRGQWRYQVRATRDPFTAMAKAAGFSGSSSKSDCDRFADD